MTMYTLYLSPSEIKLLSLKKKKKDYVESGTTEICILTQKNKLMFCETTQKSMALH